MTADVIFRIACAAVILIMLIYHLKRRKRILSIITGAATGLAALILLNKFGNYAGIDISLNTFNLVGSSVLGVPFVIALVVMNYF